MKLEPVTKLDKRNTATEIITDDDIMSSNYGALSFSQFMANLEQSGSRILDAWSVNLTFSLTVTSYKNGKHN